MNIIEMGMIPLGGFLSVYKGVIMGIIMVTTI